MWEELLASESMQVILGDLIDVEGVLREGIEGGFELEFNAVNGLLDEQSNRLEVLGRKLKEFTNLLK